MWPFNRRSKSKRDFIKKVYSKYLDELRLDNQKGVELSTQYLHFVLILVSETGNRSQMIGQVLDIIQQHDGMIESITSTFITVYVGVPLQQPNSKQLRIDLVNELSGKLGPQLAIIYGECGCPVGSVGNESRQTYTALLPEYKSKLRKLSSLQFGQVTEV